MVSDDRLNEILARVSPPDDGWQAGLPTMDIHSIVLELQRYRAALAPVEMGWQPIETAPKDGRWIMLYCVFDDAGEDQFRVCRFAADHRHGRAGAYGQFIWATYDSKPNIGVIAEKVPTHWMPLPDAPK